jgi:hypothetical protein
LVPISVQQAIKRRVNPLFAYTPTSIPRGYRYGGWVSSRRAPRGLTIWFARRGAQLGFNVSEQPCPRVRPMRVYRIDGLRILWSSTYTSAEAWRCVRRGRQRLLFYVSAPGNGSPYGPSGRALARVIASARPIR